MKHPRTLIAKTLLAAALAFAFGAAGPDAATLHVPADYGTIQEGIDAAAPGDMVLVTPGTYTGPGNKNLTFSGKDIVLGSDGQEHVVIDCEADGRGFIFNGGESAAAEVILFEIINGNMGGYSPDGGGVYCDNDSDPTFTDCVIAGCSADSGAGFFARGWSRPTLNGCTITDNVAGKSGGGISQRHGDITLTDCLISGNRAELYSGGGILLIDCNNPSYLTDCTISGNSARATGGGVSDIDNYFTVFSGCTVSGNTTDEEQGGGLFSEDSDIYLEYCTINFNTAQARGGGAAFLTCEDLDLVDCVVEYNTSLESHGGGLFLDGTPFKLTGSTISGNSAYDEGGGFRTMGGSGGFLIGCTVSGNTAHLGGGIYFKDIYFLVADRNFITGNSAGPLDMIGGAGGGIYFDSGSGCEFTNTTFTDNIATGNGARGGGLYLSDVIVTFMNCTSSGNTAFAFFGEALGGGIYCTESTSPITNCIFWGDEPDEIFCSGSIEPTVSYTDIEGGWSGPGSGNIDQDPLFSDPGGGDYHLTASSPCIDAGDGANAPDIDFEGDPRPSGEGWDMGADEYVCDLSVVLSGYPDTIWPGETLSFTASAVNDCGESHSFDRADMAIEGPASLVNVLYDGASITLPPGGEASAPVNLYVPPIAPAGVYTITVTIYRTFMWAVPIASDSFELEVLE